MFYETISTGFAAQNVAAFLEKSRRKCRTSFVVAIGILVCLIFFQPPVPITENLDPLCLLTDDTIIAKWHNEGLPSDRMSTENATILSNSDRWPLMIDPQVSVVVKNVCCMNELTYD